MANPTKTKRKRFEMFLTKLKDAPCACSRDGALDLLKQTMIQIEDEYSGTSRTNYSERMHVWSWEFEWRDLDSDPCYWDDSVSRTHRTQIFHDGRIIITNLKSSAMAVVLDKPAG